MDEYNEEPDSGSEDSFSSSSESSSSEEDRRRRKRRKKRRRHSRRERRSRRKNEPVDVPEPGPAPEPQVTSELSADGRYAGPPKVVMCSWHHNDLRPTSCRACKAMNHMIRDNLRQHLVVDGSEVPSVVPKARDRLLGKRSDHQDPTLVLSEDEVAVLEAIFGQVSHTYKLL